MVTSLFWRSAIVELSQSLTPASSSCGRLIWYQHSGGFHVSSAAIRVCVVCAKDFLQSTQQKQLSARSTTTFSVHAPKQAVNTCTTCRGIVDKATASPSAQKRMTGKYMLDVFGGPGFLATASNHLGLSGYVLDTKFGPRYVVTKPFVLTRIRQDVSAGKMCRRNDFTSTTTHFVLSQSCFRQCCHRTVASSCLPACVWGQADVALFLDRNMSIQRFPHHAQSVILHVTTPAFSVYLSRLPFF